MSTEIQHFVGGRFVPGRSGRTAPVFSPATGEQQGGAAGECGRGRRGGGAG